MTPRKTLTAVVALNGTVELKFGYDKELIDLVKLVSGFNYFKGPPRLWWGSVHALFALQYAAAQRGIGVSISWPRQAPVVIVPPAGRTLHPFQLEGVSKLLLAPSFLLAWSMRVGKAQPLDAKVLTPSGWRLMGELRVGDRVSHPSGGASIVTGVFPQGLKSVFRVTTVDGAATECCAEHLWSVQTHKLKQTTGNYVTRPLSWLIERGCQSTGGRGQFRWFLPVSKPLDCDEASYRGYLAPYVLGVLLGDGHVDATKVAFTSADQEICDRVAALLPRELCLREHGLRQSEAGTFAIAKRRRAPGQNWIAFELDRLGLMGRCSHEKFIPAEYMRLSVAHRLELLRGLMDTDGDAPYRRRSGVFTSTCVYNTTSPRLRDDVLELVRSLGGFASVTVKQAPFCWHRGTKRIGLPCWRLYIRMRQNPFALSRKAVRWRPSPMARSIVRVDPAGEKQAQCISVSASDGLYITDGHIVTHNSTVGIVAGATGIATRAMTRIITLGPANTLFGWEEQVRSMYPNLPTYTMDGRKNVLALKPQCTNEKELRDLRRQALALSGAAFVFCQHDLMAHRVADLLWLAAQGPFAVGCDEPQHFKEFKAPRSVALMDLAQHPNCFRRWAYSGTPMRNMAADMPVAFEFLACPPPGPVVEAERQTGKRQWKRSPWGYLVRYAGAREVTHDPASGASHWEASDVETEPEELKAKLWSIAHRLTREDVAPWLPKIERSVILANLSKELGTKYRALEARLGKQAMDAVNGSERQDALKTLASFVTVPKLNAVIERLRFHADECGLKTIAGLMYHESLEKLIGLLTVAGKPVLKAPLFFAAGWMSPAARQDQIALWQTCVGPAVLLCNTLANSVGIDLADAGAMVNGELAWVPSDALQWEARVMDVHKGKRTVSPIIEYVLAKGTIDEDMALAMLTKMGAIDRVIGGEREQHGLDKALRESGLVNTVDLGLSDRSDVGVQAALDGLRRRLLGEVPSAEMVESNAALAGAVAEAFEEDAAFNAEDEEAA